MSTEPVGTLAEEAAKLMAVMQDWAGDHSEHTDRDTDAGRAKEPSAAHGDESHEHASTDGCRWCPLCQTVRLAKAASPEVREHLANAAMSLALAFKGLMDGVETPDDRSEPVEKIDLDLDPHSPED